MLLLMLPHTPPNTPSRSSSCFSRSSIFTWILTPLPLERARTPPPLLAPSSTPCTPYKVDTPPLAAESLYVPRTRHNHPLSPLTLLSNCFSSPNPFCYSNVCDTAHYRVSPCSRCWR